MGLPLCVIVEQGKHATAPDIDGVFTSGVDENQYRERAKIWGVRDVIGTTNRVIPQTVSVCYAGRGRASKSWTGFHRGGTTSI
ncbi:MAG TPA: hypothetical protein VLD67_05380 [Vicinamibacterales bacterium]|nr:hypothetical protein [Vicinamibacterales bacterium]